MEQRVENKKTLSAGVLLFVACWTAYCASYLGRINYTAALTAIVADGVFSKPHAGFIGTVYFFCYGAGQIFSGILGDRVSPYKMIGAGRYTRTNKEMVFTEELTNKYDVQELKELIQEHVALTNSVKGKEILDNFGEYLPKFKKVVPYDYHHMLTTIVQMEEKGYNVEQAQIEAFYANLEAQA